jgi:glutaredoxin 3
VPNIFINGEHIGGNSEFQALNQNGDLNSKLVNAGLM